MIAFNGDTVIVGVLLVAAGCVVLWFFTVLNSRERSE